MPAAMALFLKAQSRLPNSVRGVNSVFQQERETTVACDVLRPGATGPRILIPGVASSIGRSAMLEVRCEVNGRTLPAVMQLEISSAKVISPNIPSPFVFRF